MTTKHCYILNMYVVGLVVSEKKTFYFLFFFSMISLWELMNDPRGMISRIYVGDHLTLLHTQYISYRPHGFKKEDF